MRLHVRIDPSNGRRWLLDLRDRLRREGHTCDFVAGAGTPEPSAIAVLFALEGIVHRLGGPRPSDVIPWDSLCADNRNDGEAPDAIIDLAGYGEPARDRHCLNVFYDGYRGTTGLFGALLDGRMPTITVADAESGDAVVTGVPASDNAGSVREAAEFAWARTATMLSLAIGKRVSGAHAPQPQASPARPEVHAGAMAAFLARSVGYAVARRLYKLCYYAPHWRIGWRFVTPGAPGVHDSLSLTGVQWNILHDPGVRFFADPFPISAGGRHYIFFEDFDHRDGKGVISCAEVDVSGATGPVRRVLEEPWHLSYPFLFEDGGDIFMLPESSANRSLELYRADAFPHRWTRVATLMTGVELSDATLVRHGGRLWMFAAMRDGQGSPSDTLSLFSAPRLTAPWTAHGANPLIIDQRGARPAGGFFTRSGRLWRPVQDCANGYGTGIGLAEILRLDDGGFEQRIHTVLRPPAEWPGRRLHTLSRYGQLECIDGSAHSPKYAFLRGLLEMAPFVPVGEAITVIAR